MILRQYTSQEQKVQEYGVINTTYATVKDSSNKIRYLFFKLTFEDLDKELEVSKLQFVLNYFKIQNTESMRIYGTSLTSIGQAEIEDLIYRLENNQYFPNSKEYVFEDTIEETTEGGKSVHSAVFDLNELMMELNNTKNTIVFFIKFNFDIDNNLIAQIEQQDNATLSYSADAVLINYSEGINSMSKVDTFELDSDAKLLVDNREGELFSSINLISSLSNKNPINVSLISHKDDVFPNKLFSKPLRFSFQTKIEVLNNSNNKQAIYILNTYNDTSRYALVENVDDKKYNKIIKSHEGDTGTIFFNEMDNTYLYYYEGENGKCFKIYDKDDNYSLYENSDDITKLIQVKTNDGKETNYTWAEWFLTKIENSEGDILRLRYDDDDYLLDIRDEVSSLKVSFTYSTDTINIKYYKGDTLLKTITLTIDDSNELTRIYESKTKTLYDVEYLGRKAVTITKKLKETSINIVIPPIVNPILSTDEQEVEPASIVPVIPPIGPIDPVNPGDTTVTYTTLEIYNYSRFPTYTQLKDHLDKDCFKFYDDLGRCVLEMDETGKAVSMEYYGFTPQLASQSTLFNNKKISVQNNSFEIGNINNINGWNLVKGTTSIVKIDDNGRYGKCLKIIKRENEEVKLTQEVTLEAGKSYRLGLFSKYSSITAGNLIFTLKGSYLLDNEEVTFEVKKDTLSGTESSWISCVTSSVSVPSEASNVYATIELKVKGDEEEIVYLDEVTVLSENRTLRSNLIKNAYFDFVENNKPKDWILVNTGLLDVVEDEEIFNNQITLGKKYMKFENGDVIKINENEETKKMYQVINHKGSAGDNFILSILSKCSASFNDVYKAYIKFNYDDGTEDLFEYDFARNCESMQMLTKTVIAPKSYASIEVGVEYKGYNEAIFDNIQLCKDGKVQYYNFDKIGNITSIYDKNSCTTNIIYDDENKIELLVASDGTTFKYKYYDNQKKVKSITESNKKTINYFYENDNLTKQTIDYESVVVNNTFNYDENDNQIYQKNEYNEVYQKTYDILRRIQTDTTPKGLVSSYTHDDFNNLLTKSATVNGQTYKNTLTYLSPSKIQKVESLNGSVYEFEYDDYGNLTKVSMDGIILNTFAYKTINDITTDIVSAKVYSDDTAYIFTYDSMNRLIRISKNASIIVNYSYDENDNICVINDAVNQYTKYMTYDLSNRLVRITTNTGNETNIYYDNQNNVQKVNRTVEGKNRSVEFDYEYETNEYTFDAYVNRLAKTYRDEVFAGTTKGNGRNGAPNHSAWFNAKPTFDSNGIMVYPLVKGGDNFKIDVFELNEKVKDGILYGSPYDKKDFFEKYKTTKSFVMWIKPKNMFSTTALLFARNTLTGAYIEDVRLILTSEGKIRLIDKRSNTISSYDSEETLTLNTWNLIVFKVKDDNVQLYINGTQVYMPALNGKSYSLHAMELFNTPEYSYNETLDTPIDLAYLSIGCYDYTNNDVKTIYNEGLKYLSYNASLSKKVNTRYSVGSFENNYNIITLNGSLESNRNHEPKVLSKASSFYSLDKNNIFDYDSNLGRYVYSSFDSDNKDKLNEGMLGYDLGIEEEGVISVKFKMVGTCVNARYILASAYNESQLLGIYVYNNLLKLEINSNPITIEPVEILNDKWYTLTLFINKDEDGNKLFKIYIDNTLKVSTQVAYFSLVNAITYIGRNVKNVNSELNGYLEKFVWKTSALASSGHSSAVTMFKNCTYLLEHTYEVDKVGRTLNKKIKTDNRTLTHYYNYVKNRVVSEQLPTYEERYYGYDNEGNINYIEISNQDGLKQVQYGYDSLNRLRYVNDMDNEVNLDYDTNGNIVSRAQTPLSSLGVQDVEQYTYDSTYKDRLLYMNNPITQETIQLVYEAGHNPTKLVEVHNNKVNNIIYEGKKITNYGNNEYKYNEEGIRTYKKEPAYNGTTQIGYDIHNYILEGEKILTEIINTAYYGLIRFDYNYDINGELVSLEFQNQLYYYVKDALGVIHSIIDIYGNVMVSYKYDEWGKLLNIDALDPYHPVAKYNPYIYKTYYYDYESKMYYLNSRYYHPSIRRFLTIDDISYLDYESLGNLNLYQYCNNNPIKYFDKTGKSIAVPATIGIGLIVLLCLLLVVAVTYPTIDVNNPIAIPSGDVISVDNNFFPEKIINISIIATILLTEVIVRLSSLVSELESTIQSVYDIKHKHHIVAKKAWRAELARYILVKLCHIGINDERNIADVKDIYHSHLHTNSYYGLINAGMTYSYFTNGIAGVEKFLFEVKKILEDL